MHNKGPEYEAELIKKIQRFADGSALKQLYEIYKPLIITVRSKYYLRLYDEQDWEQEALIVCYESAMEFKEKRGSFGSYFKKRLNNHAINILRYQLSQRRKPDNESVSWEKLLLAEGSVHEPQVLDFRLPSKMIYDEWLPHLSDLELTALLISLGKIDEKYIKKSLNINSATISRAKFRALQKIRKALF